MITTRRLATLLLLVSLLSLTGCPTSHPADPAKLAATAPLIRTLLFTDPVTARPDENSGPVTLQSARNETVSFSIELSQLTALDPAAKLSLRMLPLKGASEAIDPGQYVPYQIVSMPVETNRAGFVRHTGLAAGAQQLPRALLPLACNAGVAPLDALRDSAKGFDAIQPPLKGAPRTVSSAQLWLDLTIPPTAAAGDYDGSIEVLRAGKPVATLPVHLTIFDFVIPDERHLAMVGRLDWDRLRLHYNDLFDTSSPWLLSRNDPKYAEAIRVLDSIVKLGQQHRAQVVISNLQPQVKWPVTKQPQFDWADFDSVTMPWLQGSAFADKVPLGFWPLPADPSIFSYDLVAQNQYWAAVAAHFAQLNLLSHAPLPVPWDDARPIRPSDAIALSEAAARLMNVLGGVQVSVPLQDDQLTYVDALHPNAIDPQRTDQLLTLAPGIVFASRPSPKLRHMLRTDAPGLVPYAAAGGNERDVRVWSWLAILQNAYVVQWDTVLPGYADKTEAAEPNEMTWFYPGHWFGLADPVPTVQLKWLRRAAFDYEYLRLAFERGEKPTTLAMARCLVKPVETTRQSPDPAYALMTGTTDAQAWETGRQLLARLIVARVPGQAKSEALDTTLNQIVGEMLQWSTALEKPLLLARKLDWGYSSRPSGNWVDARLGLDIYNAAGVRLIGNLRWAGVPALGAWEISPAPVEIPPNKSIDTFHIRRFDMDAAIDLDKINNQTRQPISVGFSNELGGPEIVMKVVAPVASSEKLEGANRVKLDGNLSEWTAADALHDGRLVQMLNRPSVQRQELKLASTPSQIFSGWANQQFYIAFRVEGLSGHDGGIGRNFTTYQFRRAWGEDLVQVLIQPVYVGNVLGPVLHLTCKPLGQIEVDSKVNAQMNANPWQEIVGANVRYASTLEGSIWRGELAIPWDTVNDAAHKGVRPTLLRFNFVQHTNATGESASWAGPLDFGRDDSFMGLLYLRDPALAGAAKEQFYEKR